MMRIDISNLTEDFIKSFQEQRISHIYQVNRGVELNATAMKRILKAAKEMGPLVKLNEEEQKKHDKP